MISQPKWRSLLAMFGFHIRPTHLTIEENQHLHLTIRDVFGLGSKSEVQYSGNFEI